MPLKKIHHAVSTWPDDSSNSNCDNNAWQIEHQQATISNIHADTNVSNL
jgi:hypothetical protein